MGILHPLLLKRGVSPTGSSGRPNSDARCERVGLSTKYLMVALTRIPVVRISVQQRVTVRMLLFRQVRHSSNDNSQQTSGGLSIESIKPTELSSK